MALKQKEIKGINKDLLKKDHADSVKLGSAQTSLWDQFKEQLMRDWESRTRVERPAPGGSRTHDLHIGVGPVEQSATTTVRVLKN